MATENLTTYTETDPGSDFTVSAARVTVSHLDRDREARVHKDFGAAYFNAIDLDFDIEEAEASTADGTIGCGLSNTLEDMTSCASTDVFFAAIESSSDGYPVYYLQRNNFGTLDDDGTQDDYTVKYVTLTRAAANDRMDADVYSDAARTNLLFNMFITGVGVATRWRYLFAANAYNNSTSSKTWNGYIEDFDLNEAPPAAQTMPIISADGVHSVIFSGLVING